MAVDYQGDMIDHLNHCRPLHLPFPSLPFPSLSSLGISLPFGLMFPFTWDIHTANAMSDPSFFFGPALPRLGYAREGDLREIPVSVDGDE